MDAPQASPSDGDRTRAALDLAAGRDSAAGVELVQQSRRRDVRRRLVVVAIAIVVGVAVGVTWGGHHSSRDAAVAPWRTVAGLVLAVAGFVLEVGVIVIQMRAGQFRSGRGSPLLALRRAQRTRILRQVRGHEPVDLATLPLARQLATLLIRQRWVVEFFIAFPLMLFGAALPQNRAFPWWLAGVFTAISLFVAPLILRDAGRAQRFLDRTA